MATSKTTKGKKVTCEECGKQFVAGYISTHKRNQHGIYQRGPKARKNGSKPTFSDLSVVEDMVLLTDDEGGLWVAEKLR